MANNFGTTIKKFVDYIFGKIKEGTKDIPRITSAATKVLDYLNQNHTKNATDKISGSIKVDDLIYGG